MKNKDSELLAKAYSKVSEVKKPNIELLKQKKEHFDQAVQRLQELANEINKVVTEEVVEVANDIYYQSEGWYDYYSKVSNEQTRRNASLVFGAKEFSGFANE